MINRDYKFIFIRNAKSGSTSIVENWCPGYISTSQLPDHMVLPGTSTWNHDKNHIPLSHVQKNMDCDEYDQYFKFGFVRNPFDRLVSAYLYVVDWHAYFEHARPYESFEDFVNQLFVTKIKPAESMKYGPQHVFLDGCDHVGRFENLQRDYNLVCERISVYPRRLTRENSEYAWRYLPKHGWSVYHEQNPLKPRQHYTEYYNQHTRDVVSDVFACDLEQYNYSFM